MAKKSIQKDTIKIPISLNKEQLAIIESLQGIYGNSPASVIRNILVMWIHQNIESKEKKRNSSQMAKEDNQKETIKIPVSLNKEQLAIIESLQGIYGNSPASVIRNILVMWIHQNIDASVIRNILVMWIHQNIESKKKRSS
jgi:uncharacterized membrane protein